MARTGKPNGSLHQDDEAPAALVRAAAQTRDGAALADHIEVRHRRLLDREGSAHYINTSTDTVDRLIESGALPVVRLPVERADNGHGRRGGLFKRVLIDVRDLDRLIEASKERAR